MVKGKLVTMAICAALCASAGIPVSAAEQTEYAGITATATDSAMQEDTASVDAVKEASESDFEWDGTKIKKYIGKGGTVVIPGKCTEIAHNAFQNNNALTAVVIPSGVKAIRSYAFSGCENLKTVDLPAGLADLGYGVFYRCTSLKSIEIPATLTEIPDDTFAYCTVLADVNIPDTIGSIGVNAFWKCTALTDIYIPAGVTDISTGAFGGNQVQKITVDAKNTEYTDGGTNAIIEKSTGTLITGCKNTKIPSNVKKIAKFAFVEYENLEIEIPRSVAAIENYAFDGCENLVLQVYKNSWTHKQAIENKWTYKLVPPASVTDLKACTAGINKVQVTWTKAEEAEGYLIYGINADGKYHYIGMTSKTSYVDTKAMDNAYNFYFVYSYVKDVDDTLAVGKAPKYVYAKGTCLAVTNLKASSLKGGVKLTWTKSAGADGYLVYGKRSKDGTYGYIGVKTSNSATTYMDTQAPKNLYSFYWVFPYHYDKNGNRVVGPICGYVYGKAK